MRFLEEAVGHSRWLLGNLRLKALIKERKDINGRLATGIGVVELDFRYKNEGGKQFVEDGLSCDSNTGTT